MSSFIGIDPSLNGTAIAVLRGDEHRTERWVPAKDAAKEPIKRLQWLRGRLRSLLEHESDITCLAIENYSFGTTRQASRAHAAGEWGGILRLELYELLGPDKVILVTPATGKKFLTGKGNAKKDQILLKAYQNWGIEFPNDDEADAYCMARIAKAVTEEPDDLLAYQKDSLEKGYERLK